MRNKKYMNDKTYKKIAAAMLCGTMLTFTITGCGAGTTASKTESTAVGTVNDTSTSNAANVLADNTSGITLEFDEEDLVSTWDAQSAVNITFTGTSANISGSGAAFSDNTLQITVAGTYVLSGTLSDGSIHIKTTDKGTVRIILNGVEVTSTTTAPFIVEDAKKVLVTLADNTTNTFTDAARTTTESEGYSAAISSKEDLVFNGNGTLTVNAGYRNGIKSSDDLKIVSGTYLVTAKEDGIIGKDLLGIANGTFTVKAGVDGLKSTYDTDTSKGNIILTGGNYTITAENDGIQAENMLVVSDGTYNITAGNGAAAVSHSTSGNAGFGGQMRGGSANTTSSAETSESAKGIKAGNAIYVYGGNFTIDSADDAVHTNDLITISGGTFVIKTGDDGVHADETLEINGGNIDIQTCYEGLEAAAITINDGDIKIKASDDGINAASGSESDSMFAMNRGFGNGQSTDTSNAATLVINGGTIYVDASGDGLDANGNITINGGTTIVEGPTSNGDTALDFDGQCTLNGGTVMAFGSSGMLEVPTSAANGAAIVMTFSSQSAGTTFRLKDESGTEIMNYTPGKAYAAAIVYSADIQTAKTYTAQVGDSEQTVTVNSAVTTSGNVSGGMGGMQGGKGGMRGGKMDAQSGDTSGQTGVPDMSNGTAPDMSDIPDRGNGNMPNMQDGGSGNVPDMSNMPQGRGNNRQASDSGL